MWLRLDDAELLDTYTREFGTDGAPPDLCALLEELQTKPWAQRVWAVTSLRRLRFAAVPHESSNVHTDAAVYVLQRGDEFGAAFHAAPGGHSTERICTKSELASIIELYVYRLLNEEPT